jgi:hypothetical protein
LLKKIERKKKKKNQMTMFGFFSSSNSIGCLLFRTQSLNFRTLDAIMLLNDSILIMNIVKTKFDTTK